MGLTPEQIEACVLLVAWLSVNLILNMLCKWELSPEEKGGLGLSFPFFQSALDQVITLLVVGVFLKCKPEHNTLSWAQFMEFKLRLLLFSVLGCTCIVMNNASLITVGLSVNQLLKCTSPLPVMLLSFIILQTKYAYKEIACVTLIVASAILAVPMGEWKSSTAGILMIFGSVLTAAVRNVLAALLMTNAREKGLTPFVLVFYNAAYSVLPLICLWLGIERRKSLEFVADNPGYYVSVMAGISLLATMYNFLSFAVRPRPLAPSSPLCQRLLSGIASRPCRRPRRPPL